MSINNGRSRQRIIFLSVPAQKKLASVFRFGVKILAGNIATFRHLVVEHLEESIKELTPAFDIVDLRTSARPMPCESEQDPYIQRGRRTISHQSLKRCSNFGVKCERHDSEMIGIGQSSEDDFKQDMLQTRLSEPGSG